MVTLIWSTSKQHTHHPKKENKGVFFSKIVRWTGIGFASTRHSIFHPGPLCIKGVGVA